MVDPFSQVDGPPPQEVPNDPFHPFTQSSAVRRRSHRVRSGLIVGAVVVVALVACNVVSGIGRGPGVDRKPVEVEAGGVAVDALSVNPSASAPTPPIEPDPVSPDEQPTGDALTLALLRALEVSEADGQQGALPVGAFTAVRVSAACSTREIVLQQEALSGTTVGCNVDGGSWMSRYDGQETPDASSLTIDGVVPEASAWQSGAWAWDEPTRAAFVNDTDFPESLTAVTQLVAMEKDGRGVEEWLPPNQAFRCEYAAAWVRVKYRWRLSASRPEVEVLQAILSECPTQDVSDPTRAEIALAQNTQSDGAAESAVVGGSTDEQSGNEEGAVGLDPRFRTCGDANSMGYGPYLAGVNPEYDWYQDRDRDGRVCEM